MGAIVGAAYALSSDFDRKRLTQQVIELGIKPPLTFSSADVEREGFFERLRQFIDVERFLIDSLWGWGALEDVRVGEALAKLTAGKRLEEAKVPFGAVATDLISGEKVVFKRGPASLAVQASSALPGFFPPIKWEGRLLVDGAFVDLVPTDVVRDMGARLIVAVDVDQENMPVEIGNGLKALMRAVEIAARHHKHSYLRLAHLVIRPEFGEHVDSLDFSKAELCVEVGLRAAERALPTLRRLLRSTKGASP
jgi:NTE family protein